MLFLKTLGHVARPRMTFAALSAALLIGGTATEASAKPGHHRHHHHTQTSKSDNSNSSSFLNASASGEGSHSFSGIASFYGNESGRHTASGQRFDQNAMTAAHRSLPFGTKLRVTHGDRSVIVTINDRGPFVRGRILDLSTGAARAIGLTSAGVGHVTAEVVS